MTEARNSERTRYNTDIDATSFLRNDSLILSVRPKEQSAFPYAAPRLVSKRTFGYVCFGARRACMLLKPRRFSSCLISCTRVSQALKRLAIRLRILIFGSVSELVGRACF